MNRRVAAAMLLALAVPGAGHLFLGRRGRALAFFAVVAILFAVGIGVDGDVYTIVEARGSLLRLFAAGASMGSGILYVIARATEPHGSITAATFEYGRTFTLTAGLMNLLLVLDCYDIAVGRKTW
jgi:hypothetical protein